MGPLDNVVKVLVLGGSGFVGRHAVAALLDRGAEVIVGTRDPLRTIGSRPCHL